MWQIKLNLINKNKKQLFFILTNFFFKKLFSLTLQINIIFYIIDKLSKELFHLPLPPCDVIPKKFIQTFFNN